jgi:hypothetical protein
MTTAWSHLPNAELIDRIITDAQARPKVWAAARDVVLYAEMSAALDAAWAAAWDAARDAARDAGMYAAATASWDAAMGVASASMLCSLRWAALALVAWDNCGHLLDTDPEHVRVLALLGHPPAVLLLPAAIILNKSMTYSA